MDDHILEKFMRELNYEEVIEDLRSIPLSDSEFLNGKRFHQIGDESYWIKRVAVKYYKIMSNRASVEDDSPYLSMFSKAFFKRLSELKIIKHHPLTNRLFEVLDMSNIVNEVDVG